MPNPPLGVAVYLVGQQQNGSRQELNPCEFYPEGSRMMVPGAGNAPYAGWRLVPWLKREKKEARNQRRIVSCGGRILYPTSMIRWMAMRSCELAEPLHFERLELITCNLSCLRGAPLRSFVVASLISDFDVVSRYVSQRRSSETGLDWITMTQNQSTG